VDDPQRKPGAGDRERVSSRIKRVAQQGRISEADRDIRLGNVATAQSMAELDLMSRDLDQLEAVVPAATPAPTATPAVEQPVATSWSAGPAAPVAEELAEKTVTAVRTTARSIGVVTAVVLALALVGAGVTTLFGHDSADSQGTLFTPQPIATDASGDPVDEPSGEATPSGAGSTYSLTRAGVRGFIAQYRARFATTQVVDLVLYPDYAVVQVPQAGGRRHAGFLYRANEGWTDFGGVSANFPGARPVDLTQLDVAGLMRNIARARHTLGVESPTTTYVIVRQYAPADAVPSVDIHVSNEFNESGYLATRLDGAVERAYPYAS